VVAGGGVTVVAGVRELEQVVWLSAFFLLDDYIAGS